MIKDNNITITEKTNIEMNVNSNNRIGVQLETEKNIKKDKSKINKKELIITVVVLILSVIIGFIIGKAMFDALYGNI